MGIIGALIGLYTYRVSYRLIRVYHFHRFRDSFQTLNSCLNPSIKNVISVLVKLERLCFLIFDSFLRKIRVFIFPVKLTKSGNSVLTEVLIKLLINNNSIKIGAMTKTNKNLEKIKKPGIKYFFYCLFMFSIE